MTIRDNLIDQELDIQGISSPDNTRTLSEETSATGAQISSGTGDTIGGTAPDMTLTDAGATFTAQDVGRYITISGAPTGANDGTFLISGYTSGTVITYQNALGAAEAAPAAAWSINKPFSAADNYDFNCTDRKNIKGTASHVTDVPTYERPTAVGTDVPANLTNIASKTTDAMSIVENRWFPAATVAEGDTNDTITDAGNLKHADATDRTGVPVQDGADAGAHLATYVEIIDPTTEGGLEAFGYAVGQIDCDNAGAAVIPADGETVVIDDGTNPAVTFEFDDDSSVTETATLRQVDISAAADEDDVRDALITAIIGAPTLSILAEANGSGIIKLTNETAGTAGNVAITDTVTDAKFAVTGMSGGTAYAGYRIFGRTNTGLSTSPNSVEVEFRAVAKGANLSTSVAYTWERDQPTTVDYYYGYRSRLDNADETFPRRMLSSGIVSDSDLVQDVVDIRSSVGIADGDTHLKTLLTNQTNYYAFSALGVQPTAVDALNVLNDAVGDRDYTNALLTDGQTITASLEALADAISASNITRVIERLSADVEANTEHSLPSGSYTIDGTYNGANLFLFWRKQLQSPGPITAGNDYEETSTTSFTPYTKLKSGDHINYLILQ